MINDKRASSVFLSLILVTSIVLNTTACYVILIKVKKKELTHLFIISISVANLLESIVGLIPELVALDEVLLRKTPLCITSSFTVFGLAITSITHLSVLSLIRTAAIKCPVLWRNFYLKICNKTWSKATLISVCYGYGFIWAMFPVIGWSKYDLDLNNKSCSLDWKLSQLDSLSYILTVFIFCYIFPGLIIALTSYICKKAVLRQKKSKFIQNKKNQPIDTLKKVYLRICILSAITYFVIWTPYAIVCALTMLKIIISEELFTVVSIFSKLSTISNVLINCFINKSFRKHLFNLRFIQLVVKKIFY
ncbi:opsin-3 [Hydra vulgaris]|uniref:opsin-3 n=1 Tax=Hydra vulgaris TaxID=6087 RepID=UPI001F5F6723|nr:opsin-3 [Hydra vulgaris]